ncbi:hypothetical protein [Zavarzinella formosa]|uniref:hypothetical protein n=1 Tax=Zavarzinella formosa TaxID=360055 RepID=UPI0002EBE9C2|nr:hypothetical protein [Zavarzinella formosa]
MKHLFIILGLAAFMTGCGKTDAPKADATGGVSQSAGAPAADDAKNCIKEFLAQCGMQDVNVTQLTESTVPSGAKTASESWGYTFTAEYKNVFGETQKSENWVAVVAREDGKPMVRSCWDDGKNMVGGHQGHVDTPKAELLLPPAGTPN